MYKDSKQIDNIASKEIVTKLGILSASPTRKNNNNSALHSVGP